MYVYKRLCSLATFAATANEEFLVGLLVNDMTSQLDIVTDVG
jgi:hypothetical protein